MNETGSKVGFFHLPEENLPIEKVISLLTNVKCVTKEMVLNVGCLAGFLHYCLMTTSAHTHAHHYPLFESGTKIGL